jgi:hypothetical protein
LGPYMVDAYGEHRYFMRSGTRTHPMSESEVRDAYHLATRAREHRAALWASHALPIGSFDERPCVIVSALPEEPLLSRLDMKRVKFSDFRQPAPLGTYVNICSLHWALPRLNRWADGVYGDDGANQSSPNVALRLYRDGAAGIWHALWEDAHPLGVAQVANCLLAYLGWYWSYLDLRQLVEISIGFGNLGAFTLSSGGFRTQRDPVVAPTGMRVESVELRTEETPSNLLRSVPRHRLVQQFCDRLMQAFSRPGASLGFEVGNLFGSDGRPLGIRLGDGAMWGSGAAPQCAWVCDDRAILSTTSGRLVGFVDEGVILDEAGDTLAVLEFAPGRGCPDPFFITALPNNDGSPLHDHSARSATEHREVPVASGHWSSHTLPAILKLHEEGVSHS